MFSKAMQEDIEFPVSINATINLMDTTNLFRKGCELYIDKWYSLFYYLQSLHTKVVSNMYIRRICS